MCADQYHNKGNIHENATNFLLLDVSRFCKKKNKKTMGFTTEAYEPDSIYQYLRYFSHFLSILSPILF